MNYKGYTLTELIIIMGLFALLIGISAINLVGAKQHSSLNTTVEIFVGDIGQQQLKAIIGDSEGGVSADTYGIHFNTTDYVLFHGANYNVNDPTNFKINLGDNIQFNGSYNDLIFQRVSGELTSGGSIVFQDKTTNVQKTILYNIYGIITSVN
jgi:type II secretory pathway pseudopilin PulG